jgi:hypothetical protein
MEQTKMRVALFINSTTATYSQTDSFDKDIVRYSGQRKRKTFDGWFAPEKNTEFYLFYRNNSKFGWTFLGKAHSVRQISDRTAESPPVWELSERSEPSEATEHSELNEATEKDIYMSKEMVLKKYGLVSKYKSMATGIIPLE